MLDSSGVLDRRALAAIVFADPEARRDLERIVHPAVRAAMGDWFRSLDPSAHPFAVAVVPLLYETGSDAGFDAVIATTCDRAVQLRRVVDRDGLTEVEAEQRLQAQLPTSEKARRAAYVISTEGTYEDTNRRVREVVERMQGTLPR